MPRWDANSAECLVFTYKEGLLSKVAHDLKIRVTSFEISVEDGRVEATLDARSLRTVCAMKRGRENPRGLSADDRGTIDGLIRDDILHSNRFPQIHFLAEDSNASGSPWSARGTLTLHGVSRPLSASVRSEGQDWVARIQLHQPAFGIKPYRAMLGTLKVKADLDLVLRCTLPP